MTRCLSTKMGQVQSGWNVGLGLLLSPGLSMAGSAGRGWHYRLLTAPTRDYLRSIYAGPSQECGCVVALLQSTHYPNSSCACFGVRRVLGPYTIVRQSAQRICGNWMGCGSTLNPGGQLVTVRGRSEISATPVMPQEGQLSFTAHRSRVLMHSY